MPWWAGRSSEEYLRKPFFMVLSLEGRSDGSNFCVSDDDFPSLETCLEVAHAWDRHKFFWSAGFSLGDALGCTVVKLPACGIKEPKEPGLPLSLWFTECNKHYKRFYWKLLLKLLAYLWHHLHFTLCQKSCYYHNLEAAPTSILPFTGKFLVRWVIQSWSFTWSIKGRKLRFSCCCLCFSHSLVWKQISLWYQSTGMLQFFPRKESLQQVV